MAGEVQDCITFQAKAIPTGSVSFGRFEGEQLSWERRSSFSHNRYIEEVEQFSTPGSVIKKREFFEAHFRKKALIHHASFKNQNEAENQHSTDFTGDQKNYVDIGNKGEINFSGNDEGALAISTESELVEHDQRDISSVEFTAESTSCKNEKDVEAINVTQSVNNMLVRLHEDNGTQLHEGDLYCIVEDKSPYENANMKERDEKKIDLSKCSKAEKQNNFISRKTKTDSSKVGETVEKKLGGSKLRLQLCTQHLSKNPSKDNRLVSSRKNSTKIAESDNTSRRKLEKQALSQPSSPTTGKSNNSNIKLKAPANMEVKIGPETKSEKGLRVVKAGFISHQVSKETENIRHSANRSKLVAKADVRQTSTVHDSKSSDQTLTRKEDKFPVKDDVMKEAQAESEEVKTAGVKQFRKSLNLNATPLPSFNNVTASRISHGTKMMMTTITQTKSSSTQSKHPTHARQPSRVIKLSASSMTSSRETPLIYQHQSSREVGSSSLAAEDRNKKANGPLASSSSIKNHEAWKRVAARSRQGRQGNGMRKEDKSVDSNLKGTIGRQCAS